MKYEHTVYRFVRSLGSRFPGRAGSALGSYSGAALLIDVVVAVAVFGMIFGAVLTSLQRIAAAQIEYKLRVSAAFLMTSQLEKVRSVPYASVGTTTGTPAGIFLPTEEISENNAVFTRVTSVRYIDDSHDGLAGSDTNANPNDYKQVSVSVSWVVKGQPRSVRNSTFVAAPGIEP